MFRPILACALAFGAPPVFAIEISDLPSCDGVASALGGLVATMQELPSDDPQPWQDGDSFGLTCAWGTTEATRGAQGDLLMPNEIVEIGVVVMEISVSPHALTEADAKLANYVFADERANAIGGWVFARADLPLDEVLNAIPPQVVVGDTTVYIGSTGPMFSTPGQLESLTNDWSIQSALTIHALLGN